MSYKVTIMGKNYELPPRTLAVDESIEAISKLDDKYNAGEITRRDVVVQMHSFAESVVPGAFNPVDEVDTNELMKACIDIITAYDEPARKARNAAKLKEAKELLATPEVQSLIKIAPLVKK